MSRDRSPSIRRYLALGLDGFFTDDPAAGRMARGGWTPSRRNRAAGSLTVDPAAFSIRSSSVRRVRTKEPWCAGAGQGRASMSL